MFKTNPYMVKICSKENNVNFANQLSGFFTIQLMKIG